jgi:hypothetical protein
MHDVSFSPLSFVFSFEDVFQALPGCLCSMLGLHSYCLQFNGHWKRVRVKNVRSRSQHQCFACLHLAHRPQQRAQISQPLFVHFDITSSDRVAAKIQSYPEPLLPRYLRIIARRVTRRNRSFIEPEAGQLIGFPDRHQRDGTSKTARISVKAILVSYAQSGCSA